MIEFRPLTAEEIECRIAMTRKNGVSLLLYKNARCDMNILDETVGAENWQRQHYECKGNLFCGIEIYDETKKMWICKSDCGAESYTEKEKGEASDSFKRAGFNWGIGRELYTAPFIWVDAQKCTIKEEMGKYVCKDRFEVATIAIENKKIVELTINNTTKRCEAFTYQATDNKENPDMLIKRYADVLAKEKGNTAEEWITKAQEKYKTKEAQATLLLKWVKKLNEING